MIKGQIYDPDPNGNNVLEFGVDYAKRKFKFHQELYAKCLKESWHDRVLHISLLMCPKVRHNFLRAPKRRQKKMIEHMRGFLMYYHTATGKIAPCTQKHNGPYIPRGIKLIEELYPTTIVEPSNLGEMYTPKEGDLTLKMHFNDPERKPEIIPYTMGEMKCVMGIDPSLTGLPDVVWTEHERPGSVKHITVQKGTDGELTHIVQDDNELGAVVKIGDKYAYLSNINPTQSETTEIIPDELTITFTGGPQSEIPGFRVMDLQACCAIPLDPKTTKE